MTLFSPLQIGKLCAKNRVVLPPMATGLATPEGEVTDELIEHYALRASAGTGAIIVEHSYVTPDGKASKNQLSIADDGLLPGLARLARAVKVYGALVGVQLNHAGGLAQSAVTGFQPVAPSSVMHPHGTEIPREMLPEDFVRLRTAYAEAAARAKETGFDFVEVHGAHGYLISQFMSPLTNKRQDMYGGDLEKRAAFAVEVVRAIRAKIGPAFLVFYRLGADDMMAGGFTIDEAERVAPLLVEAGVDVLDVSGGMAGSRPPGLTGQGYFLAWADRIRKASGVPVICTGGFTQPEAANEAVVSGKTDLVGVGRAQLRDPEWTLSARWTLTKEGRARVAC